MKKSRTRMLQLLAIVVLSIVAGLSEAQTNLLTVSVAHIGNFGFDANPACSVQLRLVGDNLTNVLNIPEVRITKALDDTGKDLRKPRPKMSAAALVALAHREWIGLADIQCPAPAAHSIRLLEGEIDLAIPTERNRGRVVIPSFMASPGQVIAHPDLMRFGLQVIYHTHATFAAFRRAHPSAPFGSQIETDCFGDLASGSPNQPRKSVLIQITDPQRKLLGIAFERADGRAFPIDGHGVSPDFQCCHFDEVVPRDLRLVVAVAAPGVIRTERFSLKNIPLPKDFSSGTTLTNKSSVTN